ncbi:MAG TPA: TetR/AcrR family transcriptional regulator [Candidatus Sulfotelmatobacter sp.]|nr:TetR/AcrR family transcriptional regulator [Candidatus Sulfotelmatobacter sp.]
MSAAAISGKRRGRPLGGSAAIVRLVLEATLKQLGDHGVAGLSVEEIARTAGVNKTSVYRRWPTRADLVRAALLTLRDELPATQETGNLRDDLVRAVEAKAILVGTPRGRKIARAMMAFDDAEVAAIVQALRECRYSVPHVLIEHAIERGDLPRNIDPELLSELLLAPVYYRILMLNETVDSRYIGGVVDQVLAGLGAAAARARPACAAQTAEATSCA